MPLTLAVLRTYFVDMDVFYNNLERQCFGTIDVEKPSFERLAAIFFCTVTREEIRTHFGNFLPGSLLYSRHPSVSLPTLREIFLPERSFCCRFTDMLRSSMDQISNDAGRADVRWLSQVSPFSGGRCKPFRTADSYFGYAAPGVEQGDIVCVLAALLMPVVLRPIGSHYMFVSLCFVLGCMEGEVWPTVASGERELTEFSIR